MSSVSSTTVKEIIERAHDTLRLVLIGCPGHRVTCASHGQSNPDGAGGSTARISVYGPKGVSVQARCSIAVQNEDEYETVVAVERGRTYRFAFRETTVSSGVEASIQLGRAISALLLNEVDRRRQKSKAAGGPVALTRRNRPHRERNRAGV